MPNGQIKDISCRDMLRVLEKAGKIILPKAVNGSGYASSKSKYAQIFLYDESSVEMKLAALQPLRVEVVEEKWKVKEFKAYIEQFHYLGFNRAVGENMKYMVYSAGSRLLACLVMFQ